MAPGMGASVRAERRPRAQYGSRRAGVPFHDTMKTQAAPIQDAPPRRTLYGKQDLLYPANPFESIGLQMSSTHSSRNATNDLGRRVGRMSEQVHLLHFSGPAPET